MKIVTPAEMRAMDLQTVEEGYCTSLQLMQRAAEALYEEITRWMEEKGEERVLLVAGAGNNGGDAYALACLLYPRYQPALMAVGGEERSPDCTYYYEKCKALGIPFVTEPAGYPLVVEGVFGTGFRGELPREVQAVFEKITVPVAAIDLPAGMNGESGVCSPKTLKPELTVTFAYPKPCHFLADCGKVVVKDIGIPKKYAQGIKRESLVPHLPPRSEWGHKNRYGTVGLLAGSSVYSGAAALALCGALKSGAGLVFGYLPQGARKAAAAKFYGPVLRSPRALFPLKWDAYLGGSGLGRGRSAARRMKKLWLSHRPLVVDGDGLWHLQAFLAPREGVTVLTPHMGEFARLLGVRPEELRENRLQLAEEFARRYQCVLVLKDAATVITDGARTVFLSAPCSGLAKGGSGDLLAGLIAGLLAGGTDAFESAKLGVYLHNRAAHLAAEEQSVFALQPEEVAAKISTAWMELNHGAF